MPAVVTGAQWHTTVTEEAEAVIRVAREAIQTEAEEEE